MFNIMYCRYVLTIAAFIVILMMDALYFTKPKISNKAMHKAYALLIISNTCILTLEMAIMFAFGFNWPFKYCTILMTLRDFSMMAYFSCVLLYYYAAVIGTEYKDMSSLLREEIFTGKKTLLLHFVVTIIFIIAHLFLPYTYVTQETFNYAFEGLAFYLTIIYAVLTTLETIFIILFINKKKINFSERASLIWLFSLMMVILIFQTIYSEVAIMGIISSIYVLGLYFLLENPDLELVEEIDNLTDDVQKANKTKLDFLTNMSKDMSAPVSDIVSFSDTILNTEEEDKLRDSIKKIELSSKNFLEIINNALEITNVENEKLELFESNYSLVTLLDGLKTKAEEKIGDKNVKFVLNADDSIPNYLYGDSTKINQVILNIISNAIKFTEVGKIILSVSNEIKNSTITLKFKVSDTGFGIKKEDFDKVFEKYARLEDAVSRGIEGTGLGLTVAKKYVDLLGGQISIDSEYGAGTTFYVDIPQQVVEMNSTIGGVKLIEEAKEVDKAEKIDCSKYRILVVEDNHLDLEVTKRLFKYYGFEIDTCERGRECIFKYKKGEHYDMILLDHIMPEMSGIEVMQIIRKLTDYQAPPLVALTANTFQGSRDMYLKEGFDDYLPKPIEMSELDALVRKYFAKKDK